MKVTMEFDLPKESTFYTAAARGLDYFRVLREMNEYLIAEIEYCKEGIPTTNGSKDLNTLKCIKDIMDDLLNAFHVSLDEIQLD